MPGAWELRDAHRVLVGILHVDHTSIAWALGLRNLQIPGAVMPVAGMPYDMARNVICMKALEGGFTSVFFLDSDVIPPPDTIPRLLAHRLPIVSGMYCRRSPPHGLPVMIRNGQWFTDFVVGQMVEVDMVGAGCLLIQREVLEKMQPQRPQAGKHWFDWKVDARSVLPDGQALSEDFSFCVEVRRQLGVRVMVDTSIQCRHVGLAQATLGQMTPCEATPVT